MPKKESKNKLENKVEEDNLGEGPQIEANFEKATELASASEKSALEKENARGLEDRKRLLHETIVSKKGSNERLEKRNEEAENGPDGAQKNQPLPEDVKVKATAEPTSKPQNTSPKGKQL